MPTPDYAWRIAADPLPTEIADPARREAWIAEHRRLFDRSLLEKIVLVGFVCVLFAQIIPGVDRTSVQIFVGAAILIVIDSLFGLRTARRSGGASSIAWSFVSLAVANEAIVALGRLTRGDEQLALGNTIFFVGLLTLTITASVSGNHRRARPVSRASWTARRRFAKVGAFRCDRKEFRHGVHFGAGKQGDRGG